MSIEGSCATLGELGTIAIGVVLVATDQAGGVDVLGEAVGAVIAVALYGGALSLLDDAPSAVVADG